METVNLTWLNNMKFDANVDNHHITLDAAQEFGGNNDGPKPKPLILAALAGCTGMDVTSLAKKMRVDFTKLLIQVDAQKSDAMPKVYTSFDVIYNFETENDADKEKIIKMITASQEKYCGVSAMLRNIGPVTYQIILNNTKIL